DLERRIRDERAGEVANLAVLLDGERRAREAGPDRRGGVGAGRAVGEVERSAVGKRDLHVRTMLREHRRGSPERRTSGAQMAQSCHTLAGPLSHLPEYCARPWMPP